MILTNRNRFSSMQVTQTTQRTLVAKKKALRKSTGKLQLLCLTVLRIMARNRTRTTTLPSNAKILLVHSNTWHKIITILLGSSNSACQQLSFSSSHHLIIIKNAIWGCTELIICHIEDSPWGRLFLRREDCIDKICQGTRRVVSFRSEANDRCYWSIK